MRIFRLHRRQRAASDYSGSLRFAKVSLQQGLAASEQEGQPISGKFEMDRGKFQLSVYTSKDGTKVPINILMKKGARRDGTNPALLYGYGGYGISMQPYFSVQNRAWLDHGGIYVVAKMLGK